MEKEYKKKLNSLIINEITKGKANFGTLLKNLPGIYPTLLLERLEVLNYENKIPGIVFEFAQKYVAKNSIKNSSKVKIDKVIPCPHPLDFEWRYTCETRKYLKHLCYKVTGQSDKILFIGAPTLYISTVKENPLRNPFLMDNNNEILNSIAENFNSAGLINYDVFEMDPPNFKTSCVVVDPPWYKQHFQAFLWTASKMVDLNSTVFISFPSLGTRPTVLKERIDLTNFARSVGLELINTENNSIRYISPFFEFNALRAQNILNYPIDWRNGDLLVFKKIEKVKKDKIINNLNPEYWTSVRNGDLKVKIKLNDTYNSKSNYLDPIVKGDILPTVSTRDKRRKKATIWTSGNRIFRSSNPNLIKTLLESLISEKNQNLKLDPLHPISKSKIRMIQNQLQNILTQEKNDYEIYLRRVIEL